MNRFARNTCVAGIVAATATTIAGMVPAGQQSGPSTGQSSYILPVLPTVRTSSILSVGDSVGGYRMTGIPDGLGAFDNGDDTFTLLMNHELGNTAGVTRAHGGIGAFVSKWTIDSKTLTVRSGEDLIKQVYLWDTANQRSASTPSAFSFNRFCSGDLPSVSAFYNPAT